jgi:hypothetical protein
VTRTRFRHPYLTRGVVHTSTGAFAVCRGIIEAPDTIGDELGWLRVKDAHMSVHGEADSGDLIPNTKARTVGYV